MSKISLYIQTGIGLFLIGPFFGVVFLVVIGDLQWGIPIGLFLFSVISLICIMHFFKMKKMIEHNYQWYRQQHPECIQGKKIICHSCGADSIRVRGLMQRTFTREHFCGRCGEVLYFSPEG